MPTSGRRPPAMPSRSCAARIDCGRDRRADREHSLDVGIANRDRERAGIEWRREAVEHPVVRMLRLDRRSLEGEPREHLALRGARGGRPGALLLLGGHPACGGDATRQGRLGEHDDPAASQLRRRPIAEQALPAGRASLGLIGTARSRDEQERNGREHRQANAPTPRWRNVLPACPDVRQPTHTHPRFGPRPPAGGRQSAPPTRSSPHCRCTARAARAPRRSVQPGARSSPRRRRRPRRARSRCAPLPRAAAA